MCTNHTKKRPSKSNIYIAAGPDLGPGFPVKKKGKGDFRNDQREKTGVG
jgi:hypothetical protein